MSYPSTIQLEREASLHTSTTLGERLADRVASVVGSWHFILIQSTLLLLWLALNSINLIFLHHWDSYPYVLLNLCLSFQAAFTAPVILMSQNRQSAADRATFLRDLLVDEEGEQRLEVIGGKVDQILTHLRLRGEGEKEEKK